MTFPLQFAAEKWRPLKRSEYDRLIDEGVFAHEKVELIRGVLVRMSPQKAPHSSTTRKVFQRLDRLLDGRAIVYCQAPIGLSDDSEPEPDVLVVPLGNYDEDIPGRALLIVEVSDATLRYDRHDKLALYALNGVPEYWLVNLKDSLVEVYRQPTSNDLDACYLQLTTYRHGDTISPEAFPDVKIALAEILPTPE